VAREDRPRDVADAVCATVWRDAWVDDYGECF
jgi:hypothetical protein